MERNPPTRQHITRAADEVRAHPERTSLALFTYDVMARQAEGRSLFAGSEFMQKRAEAHGVDRESAVTALGNLLAILEKGPAGEMEWALVAAHAVRGFGLVLSEADSAEQADRIERFISHADWLEMCSPYRIYPFIDLLLDEATARSIHQGIGRAILKDDARQRAAEPALRAQNAVRLTALVESSATAARDALGRIAVEAADSHTRTFARVHAPEAMVTEETTPEPLGVSGVAGGVPIGGLRSLLRWVSGWALLSWVGRLLGKTVGWRREARVEVSGGALRVCRQTVFRGRVVSQSEQRHSLRNLAVAGRQVRFPAVYLAVGVVSLSIGVLLGGLFAFDALRVGDLTLAVIALVMLLGAALDLALDVLLPGRAGRVVLDIRFKQGQALRVVGVGIDDADRFLHELEKRLGDAT